jgi:hypothetical protein
MTFRGIKAILVVKHAPTVTLNYWSLAVNGHAILTQINGLLTKAVTQTLSPHKRVVHIKFDIYIFYFFY